MVKRRLLYDTATVTGWTPFEQSVINQPVGSLIEVRANEKVRALYLGSDRGRPFDRLRLFHLQQRSRDDVCLGARHGGNPILDARKAHNRVWPHRSGGRAVHSWAELLERKRRVQRRVLCRGFSDVPMERRPSYYFGCRLRHGSRVRQHQAWDDRIEIAVCYHHQYQQLAACRAECGNGLPIRIATMANRYP